MNKKSLSSLGAAVSAALLAAATTPAANASTDPFVTTELAAGYNLASNDKDKMEEGACGSKQEEGKCGDSKDKAADKDKQEKKEESQGKDKHAEGKCGAM